MANHAIADLTLLYFLRKYFTCANLSKSASKVHTVASNRGNHQFPGIDDLGYSGPVWPIDQYFQPTAGVCDVAVAAMPTLLKSKASLIAKQTQFA